MLEEYDLQGRNLEGVTLPFPPYVYLSGRGEGVGGTCRGEEGYLVDLVRVLGNRVRFDSRAIVKRINLFENKPTVTAKQQKKSYQIPKLCRGCKCQPSSFIFEKKKLN